MASQFKTPGELFSESSKLVQRNLRLFIIFNIVTILSTAWDIGLLLRDRAAGTAWGTVFWRSFAGSSDYKMSAVLSAVLSLAGVILLMMAGILSVLAIKRKTVDWDDIWQVFKVTWWRLIAVVIIIVIPIIAGLILFIIPGLYLLSRLAFAPYIVIEGERDPFAAARASWDITRGKAWPVFVAVFFGFILNLPSIIPVLGPVVSLVLTIAYSCGVPLRYFEMKGKR